MTNFSPSTQAVWTAFHQSKCEISPNYAKCLANAIRAAADHLDYIDSLYEVAAELEDNDHSD